MVQSYRFALHTTPAQNRALVSHAGAARFAHNHMLALVKATMDQRAAERSYGIPDVALTPSVGWSLAALRRLWNTRKATHAPWWRENSKEAYNTGLDSLARALDAWSRSRSGERAGPPVGFPRAQSRRRRPAVRFTTGALRVETDRHHVTLPRVGTVRTHESTRKLSRRLEDGRARVLSATVSRDSRGRWHVAFNVVVQRSFARPPHARVRHSAVGVDVGVRDLLVVAAADGTPIERVSAPRPLTAAQSRLRALQRRAARQVGPYDGEAKRRRSPSAHWQRTQARIGRAHARIVSLRNDRLHKATTKLAQEHDVITVETLNAAGLVRAGGARKRGLNRALADAALAEVRRMLAYKTTWYGSRLVEADRWFPSTKTCSGCGNRKPRLLLSERTYTCDACGLVMDRDLNAAINLARLGETQSLGESGPAGSGPVAGRGATRETDPAPAGDAAGCEASIPHRPRVDQPGTASPQGEAA